VNDVLTGGTNLQKSKNKYDWPGHGIYFWDNSPSRALEYASFLAKNLGRSKKLITKPAVIGAVVNLGSCLDLFFPDGFPAWNIYKLRHFTAGTRRLIAPFCYGFPQKQFFR